MTISIIFSIQLLHLGSLNEEKNSLKKSISKDNYRADIIDRNGNYLVKTVRSIDIGINPVEIIDKKKLLINLKLIFPKKNYLEVKKKINRGKFFYLEKTISAENFEKIMMLGDKAIKPQEKLTRIYPQVNGKIERILVEEGASVREGQALVKLVDDHIRIGIKALRTDLSLKKAEKEKLLAEKFVFEAELQSELATQKEVIKVRNLEYASVKDRLTLAEKNLARVNFLYQKELISEDKFMSEKDKVLILRGEKELKKARINVARQEYQQLKTTNKKVDVILEKVKIK